MKSIAEQIWAMEYQWPDCKLVEQVGQTAVWEGVLAPDKRRHLVRVRYRVPLAIENLTLLQVQPRVQVINPQLERHWDYDEGPIPHVYVNDNDRSLPYLCLFDPTTREWDVDDLIAQTTIFWAWEWLYFYEAWLVTKKWQGGGRHFQRVEDGEKRLATV
jgi:hypothetical protein